MGMRRLSVLHYSVVYFFCSCGIAEPNLSNSTNRVQHTSVHIYAGDCYAARKSEKKSESVSVN